jgi:predicted metal-dependent enzyme (double-stranded beta helix superfamily)
VFDAEAFVIECQSAANAADSVGAVQEVVAGAIRDGSSIDAAFGTKINRDPDTLFASKDLTVQRILWPGGSWTRPHDHRMWAVIGVYAGEELNRLYERTPGGITETGTRPVAKREVLLLDAKAIHSVENPYRELTAGLHVYGGDIIGGERSAWGPDGREVASSENLSRAMSMFQAMRDLAAERGRSLDDDARYEAFQVLRAACERQRRYPTSDEARQLIADAWSR